MEKQKGRDLKVSGIANASGGAYDKAKIEGIGKVHGDLDCNDLKMDGKCTIKGNVKAGVADIDGMATIAGSMSADKLTIDGYASIGGGFSGEELEVEGYLSVAENCQAETCVINGGVTISGLLNAGTIQLKLYGNSRVKEIGGEAIQVKKGSKRFSPLPTFPFVSFTSKLTVDTIEGDEIYLEATQARIVRGNHVTIGPGCEIERVEYREEFQQDKGARVGSHEKM
ncbi:hypothetical protein ACI7RC_21835 [Brevibacillus sp. B_LB10_24]|uniref:hypothetical protein n=1 Tax=Brevibacillus sp. B_LB10_24 TaxID=3380645 RepID=UPI0038BCD664